MENVTVDVGTDHTQFMEYQVAVMMWKVFPPFILVLGTFGNLATILVMSRIKDNNSSQYVILMALAMADLCVLYSGLLDAWLRLAFNVSVPGFHVLLCKLYIWAVYASTTASAWLVTSVAVQRTMAVLWPHRMRVMCTVRRTWVAVVVVLMGACCVHLHMMVGLHLVSQNECSVSGQYLLFIVFIWNWVDMCISSFGPSACLLLCSVILSWTLFQSASLSSTAVRAMSNVNTAQSQDGRKSGAVKVTVMVLALSCTFLVLTLPVCIYNVWHGSVNVDTPKTEALSQLFRALAFLMWYSNSAVNFLLYCITGARFRREFVSLLLCGAKDRSDVDTRAFTSTGGGSKQLNNTSLSA